MLSSLAIAFLLVLSNQPTDQEDFAFEQRSNSWFGGYSIFLPSQPWLSPCYSFSANIEFIVSCPAWQNHLPASGSWRKCGGNGNSNTITCRLLVASFSSKCFEQTYLTTVITTKCQLICCAAFFSTKITKIASRGVEKHPILVVQWSIVRPVIITLLVYYYTTQLFTDKEMAQPMMW